MSVRASLSAAALVALVAACSSDDDMSVNAQIKSFCNSFASAPAFSCCTAEDRKDGAFISRYRYNSAAECADVLTNQAAQAEGKQGFDNDAAQSCLNYLNSRQCGITALRSVNLDEQKAGCARVLVGLRKEGEGCVVSEDCETGLVCPPIKETGLSFCAKPAGFNINCLGTNANSIDHPACQQNLFCEFQGENPAGCPNPPCLIYQCVPPIDEGEPCSGTECADGLTCREGTCQKGAKTAAGENCQITDQCADGLYCDPGTGSCTARKDEGVTCDVANNDRFECKGVCRNGSCSSFCGQ